MTLWIQDYLPGMEFPGEDPWPPPWFGSIGVTHSCPPLGELITPCCRRTPFELPRTDRITLDLDLVTCGITCD